MQFSIILNQKIQMEKHLPILSVIIDVSSPVILTIIQENLLLIVQSVIIGVTVPVILNIIQEKNLLDGHCVNIDASTLDPLDC